MQSVKNIVNLLIVLALVWLATHPVPVWARGMAILAAVVMIVRTGAQIVRRTRGGRAQ